MKNKICNRHPKKLAAFGIAVTCAIFASIGSTATVPQAENRQAQTYAVQQGPARAIQGSLAPVPRVELRGHRAIRAGAQDVDARSPLTADALLSWFGGTDPATGAALPDSAWRFDQGGADLFEGWESRDVTAQQFTAWRRITSGNWAGHGNPIPAPIIGGSASVWLGVFDDEAETAGWGGGMGYGNAWCQQLRSPKFVDTTGAGVTFTFDYFHDSETEFDFTHVYMEQNGSRQELTAYDGNLGSPTNPLTEFLVFFPSVGDTFTVLFEFASDEVYSNEDGLFTSTLGAFGVDNIDVTGAGLVSVTTSPPFDFEAGDHGFTFTTCPAVGDFAAINDVSNYSFWNSCGLTSNITSIHDGSGAHPAGQWNVIISPPVPVADVGAGPFEYLAEYSVYSNLTQAPPFPVTQGVYRIQGWSYYPFVTAGGETTWSPFQSDGFVYYDELANCQTIRAHFTHPVFPSGPVDSLRFGVGVRSFDSLPSSNFSPIFDNIRVGVRSPGSSLDVPAVFVEIQEAIDAASDGDTIRVSYSGSPYRGPLNKNLNFNGKDLYLVAVDTPFGENVVIDCEGSGRGFVFQNGETDFSVVEGFTVWKGAANVGGGIYVSNASPRFASCRVDSCFATDKGGGIYIENGSPRFDQCEIVRNVVENLSAPAEGGGFYANGGDPVFFACDIEWNTFNGIAQGKGAGGYATGGGSVSMSLCRISSNAFDAPAEFGGGLGAENASLVLSDCYVSGNQAENGGGILHINSPYISMTRCTVTENDAAYAGGVYLGANGQVVSCVISSNTASESGGGMYLSAADLSVDSTTIYGNTAVASHGGGVYSQGNAVLSYCVVDSNQAGSDGGGLWCQKDNISGGQVSRNIAGGIGGGIYYSNLASIAAGVHDVRVVGNSATTGGGLASIPVVSGIPVERCVIAGNFASENGGGMYVESNVLNSPFELANNVTVSDNQADGTGGGIHVNDISSSTIPRLLESIVWNNCAAGSADEVFALAPNSPISFECSIVDSSEVVTGLNSTVTYDANTTFQDPLFCSPGSCTAAPTTLGNYTLAANSPALAANSPCGSLIGALGEGCSYGGVAPVITSILDVPGDQGGQVRATWGRALDDAAGTKHVVTGYSVWRQNGATWDSLTTVPASGDATYHTVLPTSCDSTSSGTCYTTLQLRMLTTNPLQTIDSPPDSGYSVDNLIPGAPQNPVIAPPSTLAWQPNSEPDFDLYTVYATNDTSILDSALVVGSTTFSSFELPVDISGAYVFVTAKDRSGNESPPSNALLVNSPTAVGGNGTPLRFALYDNFPNPFNPATTIRFDTASQGRVEVQIYDVGGRLVRTLVNEELPQARHSVAWDGHDDRGMRVSSGVYFYKLVAGDFARTKKMVLLK